MAPPRLKTSRPSAVSTRDHCHNDLTASDNHNMQLDDEEQSDPTDYEPESQGMEMDTLIAKMVHTQRKRHALTKQTILTTYTTATKSLQDCITSTFDAHEEEAAAAHTAQLTRLKELLASKRKIETMLAEKLAHLTASYDAHSRDLENVIAYRVEEMK